MGVGVGQGNARWICGRLVRRGQAQNPVMDKATWDSLDAMTDWDLLDFTTERDSSQRKHAAQHILAMRRNKALERVAMWSAIAAALSAVVAVAQLFK